jgi:hypothetical protein
MEIESFVLGLISAVLLASLVILVSDWLRIRKLEKAHRSLELLIKEELENIWRRRDEDWRETQRWLEAHSKDATMIERTLGNQLGEQWARTIHELQHRDRALQEQNEYLMKKVDEALRYTDSRIDRTLRDVQEASHYVKQYRQEKAIIKEG